MSEQLSVGKNLFFEVNAPWALSGDLLNLFQSYGLNENGISNSDIAKACKRSLIVTSGLLAPFSALKRQEKNLSIQVPSYLHSFFPSVLNPNRVF